MVHIGRVSVSLPPTATTGPVKPVGQSRGSEINSELDIPRNRELALQDAKYKKYSDNLEQARLDQALEMNKISNISVVRAASDFLKPVWPEKARNLPMGVLFGILGGIGLTFTFEHFDHTLKTPKIYKKK
jgi:hypothetical protein